MTVTGEGGPANGRDSAVAALLDKQAIHEVVLRYCRGVDRGDLALVRDCYHPDAVEEHGSFQGGLAEFLPWLEHVLTRYAATMHLIANHLVELDADRARSEAYGVAHHQGHDQTPAHNLTVGFRYVDRFERRDGQWRIARRVAVTEWVHQDPAEQRWPTPEGLRRGRRDVGDVLYEV